MELEMDAWRGRTVSHSEDLLVRKGSTPWIRRFLPLLLILAFALGCPIPPSKMPPKPPEIKVEASVMIKQALELNHLREGGVPVGEPTYFLEVIVQLVEAPPPAGTSCNVCARWDPEEVQYVLSPDETPGAQVDEAQGTICWSSVEPTGEEQVFRFRLDCKASGSGQFKLISSTTCSSGTSASLTSVFNCL